MRDGQDRNFNLFGKRTPDPDAGYSVEATIEDVRATAAGNRIMRLSNGQVWVEREAGRRRIDTGQTVVILKRRFHYTMELQDQNRRITVKRID